MRASWNSLRQGWVCPMRSQGTAVKTQQNVRKEIQMPPHGSASGYVAGRLPVRRIRQERRTGLLG